MLSRCSSSRRTRFRGSMATIGLGHRSGQLCHRAGSAAHTRPRAEWHDRDPKDLDVKVKVGWVKGLNRLYVLYEAYDNYWDFSRLDLHNDIFEFVVDGDASGGPLVDVYHRDVWSQERQGASSIVDPRISRSEEKYSRRRRSGAELSHLHSARRQGLGDGLRLRPDVKDLPYANHAYKYNFKPGSRAGSCSSSTSRPSTTPGARGRSVPSNPICRENEIIGTPGR